MDLCSGRRCPIPACLRWADPDKAGVTATFIEANFIRDPRADQMVEQAASLSMVARATYCPTATCVFAAVRPRTFRLWLGSRAAVGKQTMQVLGISSTICADPRFIHRDNPKPSSLLAPP